MLVKKGTLSEERRNFLKKAGGLTVMTAFGLSFFTSCGDDDDVQPINDTNNDNGDSDDVDEDGIVIDGDVIRIDLDSVEDLQNEGAWLLISEADVLVVNDGGIIALTAICTHAGCSTNWSFSGGQFRCSCHGSQFATDGSVVQGPATRPLERFDVEVDGSTVTITT